MLPSPWGIKLKRQCKTSNFLEDNYHQVVKAKKNETRYKERGCAMGRKRTQIQRLKEGSKLPGARFNWRRSGEEEKRCPVTAGPASTVGFVCNIASSRDQNGARQTEKSRRQILKCTQDGYRGRRKQISTNCLGQIRPEVCGKS